MTYPANAVTHTPLALDASTTPSTKLVPVPVSFNLNCPTLNPFYLLIFDFPCICTTSVALMVRISYLDVNTIDLAVASLSAEEQLILTLCLCMHVSFSAVYYIKKKTQ